MAAHNHKQDQGTRILMYVNRKYILFAKKYPIALKRFTLNMNETLFCTINFTILKIS